MMGVSPGAWAGVIGGAAILSLALSGCASRGSVRDLHGQIAAIRDEVEELRKLHESSARKLEKTVAELRALEGQVATLARAGKETAEKVERVDTRLTETDQAVRGVRTSLDGLSQELVRRAAAPAPPEKPAEREQAPRPGAAEQLYAAALQEFRAREHGQAVLEFTDFIARYPHHALVSNAQFWIGEAYYVQRDYQQALVEYRKVTELNSKGPKVPDALFRIGLCYRALNEPARARETWQRLVQTHPDSDAARQARSLIQARPAPVGRTR